MWNRVILWVAYFPILITTSSIFLLYTVALVPVTYVKLVFHKLVMIFVYSKSYRVTKADKFMQWILFVIIGGIEIKEEYSRSALVTGRVFNV